MVMYNMNVIFIDTWGWITLGNNKEKRHKEVSQFYKELIRKNILIYTSDYILDELITFLFKRISFDEASDFIKAILKSGERGPVEIEKVTSKDFTYAWELRQTFKDKPHISFTDLTSMSVMKRLKINNILTDDAHFYEVGMGFNLLPGNPEC